MPPRPKKISRPNLTNLERSQMISELLLTTKQKEQKFRQTNIHIQNVAKKFKCSRSTVYRIWSRAISNFKDSNIAVFEASSLKNLNGRFKKWNQETIKRKMKRIPFQKRRTIRDLAVALAIPKSTIHWIFKNKEDKDVIIPHSNSIRPYLSLKNRQQ